jgi:23S rRNA pseudouridine1911/1915/1917 synthase
MREEFTVTEENGDVRIDIWLSGKLPDNSRSELQRLIQDEKVTVDGDFVKPSTQVFPGQKIIAEVPEKLEFLTPSEVPFFILYEDEEIVVVEKPVGVVVHPGVDNQVDTLVQGLLFREIELAQTDDPERPGVVHRLDKDTSGAIIFAKTSEAHAGLINQFQRRQVTKFYLSVVRGTFQEEFGRIEAPIARDPKHPTKMKVIPHGGKESFSDFYVAHNFENHAAVVIKPITGRTHQIRVHFASIDHPVVGDPIYGNRRKDYFEEIERMMLHAWKVRFIHPITGDELEFTSPPPDEFVPSFDVQSLESPLLTLESN